nr:hypothetical protein [Tanacetum cinerariifolium]
MKYGPEVAKELTPLLIFGQVVKNLPVYYDYVVSGKLKEIIHVRVWQSVEDFRNLGYKRIWKQVQEWIVDKADLRGRKPHFEIAVYLGSWFLVLVG